MKKAFTMLELVFVIVVAGILAAVIIPSTKTNPAQEAAIDLVSKIRYTQHLGMVDDKFDAGNSTWMRNRWRIEFSVTNGANYEEYSITNFNQTNGAGTQIYAKDPQSKAKEIKDISLKDKYNITVGLSSGCNGHTNIGFDHVGRPIVGDMSDDAASYISGQLMTSTCVLTLTNGTESVDINISAETGYARIVQP